MAILTVSESFPRSAVRGQVGRRLYTRTFVVTTSNPHDGEFLVGTAPGIPQPYEPYVTQTEFDNGAVVRNVRPQQRPNSRTTWDVTVEYDSEYERRDNPFTEPPDIQCTSETYEAPLPGRAATFYDPTSSSPQSEDPVVAGGAALVAWGNGVLTSAGEPFDPPATVTRSRPIVSFTRNQAAFFVADKVKYENTVNRVTWCGLPARQAWLRSINATSHVQKSTTVGQADIPYYRVEYTFALKAETWDLFLLDIGSYYLDYSSGSAVRRNFYVEGTGEPRLGLLDHSNAAQPGKKLAAGQDAQFLRWRGYREENFADLNIDLNLSIQHRRARPRF